MRVDVAVTLLLAAAAAGEVPRPRPPGEGEYAEVARLALAVVKFVDWPEHARGQGRQRFRFGVVGRPPSALRARLQQIASRGFEVHGRSMLLEFFATAGDIDPDVHAVFVCPSERLRLAGVLARVSGRSVLTVSDIPGFAAAGGTVGLARESGKFRPEINAASVHESRLRVASSLLALARVVGRRGGGR